VIARHALSTRYRAAARANTMRVSISHGRISLSTKNDHDEGLLRQVEPFALAFTTSGHIS